jgi:hypothetical protein
MKQEEEIRRTCRVEQFLSMPAFDRSNDISLQIQLLLLTKHRFLLLSFVDRFLPEILYIEIKRRLAFGDAITVVKRVWFGFWMV